MKRRLLLPAVLLASALPLLADETPAPAAAPAATAPQNAAANPEADKMWSEMERLQQPPTQKPASREELMALVKQWFGTQKAAADTFVQKFPTDPRSWKARMISLRAEMQMRRYNNEPSDPAADAKRLDEIVNAPDAPANVKGEASFMLLMIQGTRLSADKPEAYAAFYKSVADYLQKYPDHPLAGEVKSIEMRVLNEDPTPQATEMLKKLAGSTDPRLAEVAKSMIERKQKASELKSKPVDLKFTAADGQPVDLANLRGKVVLLDFWASWCGPCMHEMPNVVSTYEKLHDKGFEIVGISLDQDKGAMDEALKSQKMTWPQHFDGASWQGKIVTSFGVDSIPAAWLLDKKGMVREVGLRGEELGAAIEKLLAE